MFIRPFTLFFSVLSMIIFAGMAVAAPTDVSIRDVGVQGITIRDVNQCNTGPVQCCKNIFTSSSSFVSTALGIIGLPTPSSGLIGLSCTALTSSGFGAASTCTQSPVCCSNNTFNGLINIGCSPIIIDAGL